MRDVIEMKPIQFKFMVDDWMSLSVQSCSRDAKAVLMDLICVLARCDSPGTFITNGKPWTLAEIGATIPGDREVTTPCIRELIEKGALKRDLFGAVCYEPMTRQNLEKRAKPVRSAAADVDAAWIEELCDNEAYRGIDVPREAAKMEQWCKLRQMQPTRRRFLNWLNRVEKPMTITRNQVNPNAWGKTVAP